MLEPKDNPNSKLMVDPPRVVRWLMARVMGRVASTERIHQQRGAFEAARVAAQRPHEIEYFHQLDDPYSHLMAQVLATFAERYDVTITPRLIRASGGKNQPESEKLAVWARRDAELIAPHYGLEFPAEAGVKPPVSALVAAGAELAKQSSMSFIAQLKNVSDRLWSSSDSAPREGAQAVEYSSEPALQAALDVGSARIAELNHYSGASLYYGGEWYWGVDRLFHLEQRLRDLGVCRTPDKPFLVPRPEIEVSDLDASQLQLHFYPSLNSPYTSIIFDRTVALAQACGIEFHHKPVLPMIMRGVAATQAKGRYIFFDTKREADFFGVPFGHHVTPIGTPTRQAYSLLPFAKAEGRDAEFLSALLRMAFAEGKGLHLKKNIRRGVELAGMEWAQAKQHFGSDDWRSMVEQHQIEMVEGMGLWGVPCYRLQGPSSEPDLEVWGQDRLWLVAKEIRRRTNLLKAR